MIHFHKWSQWKTTESFVGEYAVSGGYAVVTVQRRHCAKCGKVELNRQVA